MFFYTALLIASLVGALVVLWVFRTIRYNAGSVYKTVITDTEIGPTSQLQAKTAPATSSGSESPWGWNGHQTPANAAKTHAALPTEKPQWDWSGKQNQISENQPHRGSQDSYAVSNQDKTLKAGARWPHREEKSEFAGKAYKVTRKAPKNTSASNTESKPWGW